MPPGSAAGCPGPRSLFAAAAVSCRTLWQRRSLIKRIAAHRSATMLMSGMMKQACAAFRSVRLRSGHGRMPSDPLRHRGRADGDESDRCAAQVAAEDMAGLMRRHEEFSCTALGGHCLLKRGSQAIPQRPGLSRAAHRRSAADFPARAWIFSWPVPCASRSCTAFNRLRRMSAAII